MKLLLGYLILCIIETIWMVWMINTGRWQKLEDETFGEDAWKNRITQYLPENNQGLSVVLLFLSFFLFNPVYLWSIIKRVFT